MIFVTNKDQLCVKNAISNIIYMNYQLIEAVIFDMDGVVIDTRPPIEAFWYKLADKYGIVITSEIMEQKIHGCPARQTVYALFSHLPDQVKEEILESCEYFETHLDYIAMAGIKQLLLSLKKQLIPVALVTSSLSPKVSNVVKQLTLEGLFTVVVTADLVEKGKPDPACYRLAAKQLGKNPQHCIVFEDAVSGVKAATGAGMLTVGVGAERQKRLLTEVGAVEVIPDFEKVVLVNKNAKLYLHITSSLILNLATNEYINK